MSAGSFTIAGYETDAGDNRPVRVQPETITSWNPESGGTVQGDLIRVSGGRRRIGRKARSVRLVQNLGAAVNGIQPKRSITLPVFTTTAFQALAIGQAVAYNGSNWTVSGVSSEAGR